MKRRRNSYRSDPDWKNKPLIFLDIDGVLNSTDTRHLQPLVIYYPLKRFIRLLNIIIFFTKANIIISSDWRKSHNMLDFIYIMIALGFKGTILGETAVNSIGESKDTRPAEIRSFIKDNVFKKNYVILDDSNFNWYGDQKDKVVLTAYDRGLRLTDVIKAIKILKR